MDLELAGKVVLVTGSSAGIGLGIARILAVEGATVVLNGRDAGRLEQARDALPDASAFVADVRDPAECQRLVREVLQRHDRLDVLVCNVGSGASVPPGQETPDGSWTAGSIARQVTRKFLNCPGSFFFSCFSIT